MATKRSAARQDATQAAATLAAANSPAATEQRRKKNRDSKARPLTLPGKDSKPKKIKMVRDSYTLPESDYAKLAELKKTCLNAGVHVKKSELLRAGLAALAKLSTAGLLKTVDRLVKIKTGRPEQ